jgi:hypothetical protein
MRLEKLKVHEKFNQVVHLINLDNRVTSTEMALLYGLIVFYVRGKFHSNFQVSRSGLMRISKISSTRTYHKSINNLIKLGYIEYHPSYHPKLGSMVSWINTLEVKSS